MEGESGGDVLAAICPNYRLERLKVTPPKKGVLTAHLPSRHGRLLILRSAEMLTRSRLSPED